jgi:hypothetical protein
MLQAIPDLEQTCERYLSALAPLTGLTDAQKKEAAITVKEFLAAGGGGAMLNEELHARDAANLHTSYINPFWDDMYLEGRWRTMVDSNPGTNSTNGTNSAAIALWLKRGM